MNHHFDDFLNDDELSEAFAVDPAEPTDEHIEQLRRQVALHTSPATPSRKSTATAGPLVTVHRRRMQIPLSLATIAAAVLIAFLVARPFVKDASAGLQDSLTATREALWIHGSTTVEYGDKIAVAESWCSPAERVVAFRSPQMMHFVDFEQRLQSSYTDEHGKVFQWNADPTTEGFGSQFVHALLNDQDLKSTFPFHDVSEVKKTAIETNGGAATQYSYYVQLIGNPNIRWTTSIQTDPTSGRIIHWQDHHANGMQVAVSFDYPETGPHDIFELGAPPASEVVRIATPDSDLFNKLSPKAFRATSR